MAPKPTPGQAAWLNHIFGGQQDFRRKPEPKPQPSPAQRGAQTRARSRAAARGAAVPDYTPEMQGTGDTAARRRFVTGSNTRPTSANRLSVLSGGRASATAAGAQRPPIGGTTMPPVYEGGYPVPSATSKAARGSRFARYGRAAFKGIGGPIGGALAAAEVIKQVGIESGVSKPYNVIIGPAETKAARMVGPKAVSDAKRLGSLKPPTPKPAAKPVTPPKPATQSNVLPSGPAPKPASKPTSNGSRLSDYGAGPKGKTGKFLRKAYYTNRLYAMQENKYGDVGAVSTPEARSAAIKEFKRTHKWARNAKTAEQKRNLNAAITYLQKSGHPSYWTP